MTNQMTAASEPPSIPAVVSLRNPVPRRGFFLWREQRARRRICKTETRENGGGEPSGDAQEELVKDILHGRVFEPALGHTGAHW